MEPNRGIDVVKLNTKRREIFIQGTHQIVCITSIIKLVMARVLWAEMDLES